MSKFEEIYGIRYKDDYKNDSIKTSKKVSVIIENLWDAFVIEKESVGHVFDKRLALTLKSIKKQIEGIESRKKDLFSVFECSTLSRANIVTRTTSSKIGHLLEEIITTSSNVFNPETELGIKLKGVDFILRQGGKFYYVQVKTKKDTLTGSQSERTTEELSGYDNKFFVALIETDSNWTYNGSISKMVGREFWDFLGMEYQMIRSKLKCFIKTIEKEICR